MENINSIQLKILSTLLFKPQARFKELNTELMTTDNFSYHIRSLLNSAYIRKTGQLYSLTAKGKMMASKIDTITHTIEKQPKVSVFLIPHKTVSDQEQYLIQQRLKEPFFGYFGFLTGKVKFGETLEETAQRELLEEAGFLGKFKYCYEIHEMVYDKSTGEQLEDKFFQVMEARDLEGNLQEKNPEGKCQFVSEAEFRKITPKYHNEQDLFDWFLKKDFKFKEEKYYVETF